MPDEPAVIDPETPATEIIPPPPEDGPALTGEALEQETSNLFDGIFEGEGDPGTLKKDVPEQKAVKPTKEAKVADPVKDAPKSTKEPTQDEEVKPQGLSPKAGAAWEKKNETIRELKAAVSAKDSEFSSYKQEIEEKFKGYIPPEHAARYQQALEEQQQKLDQQEAVITKIRHEMHPKYKESIAIPMENTIAKAKAIAERNNLKPSDIIAAISDADGNHLDDIIGSLGERDKVAVLSLADKYQELITEKQRRDEQAQDELKRWDEDSQRESEENMNRQRSMRARDISEKLPVVAKKFERFAETDEEKGVLKAALDYANQDVLWEKPASVQGAAAVALAMAPIIMKKNSALADENAALKEQLSGFRKTQPGAGGGPQPSAAAAPTDEDDELGGLGSIVSSLQRSATPIGAR